MTHADLPELDDIGQARVTAIETKARRARRVRLAQLLYEVEQMAGILRLELDSDHPAPPPPSYDDWPGGHPWWRV